MHKVRRQTKDEGVFSLLKTGWSGYNNIYAITNFPRGAGNGIIKKADWAQRP